MASDWFAQEVAPRVSSYREQADRMLKRKVAVFRETVIAVLSARLTAGSGHAPQEPMRSAQSGEGRSAQVRADLARARSNLRSSTDRVSDCTPWLATRLARELAAFWREERDDRPTAATQLRVAIARHSAEIGDVIAEELKDFRGRLQQVLANFCADARVAEELPQARGRPIYDSDSIPALLSYTRPRWACGLSGPLFWAAQRRIDARMAAALREQLSLYSTALRLWGERYLDELTQHFENALAGNEGIQRSRAAPRLESGAAEVMQRDLERLQRWPAQ
jgi:hypothetical protein